ncbi:MAG: secreted protein [Ferruginibacter sp.]|uniref:family 78 glycoside hydrolase catalytic domain n=1 Tax=Ferruginibacter sp. TaxID=1940288 RepID=UPI002659CEB7|nr:family 78 glycoside hydrolase catalytic domain [Ferruginibacter sp.]MDB5276210.1 secreted protein [Ferruginibacter sp.]
MKKNITSLILINKIFWRQKIGLLLMLLFCCFNSEAQLKITSALCENKVNPAGVVLQKLRFGWELSSTEHNQYQTAYQLVIASSKNKLDQGDYDVYNSDVVKSRQSVLVDYKGQSLQPGQLYYWKLQVWDNANHSSGWSSDQQFITGLFSATDWSNAKWIGYEELNDSMRMVPGIHEPYAETLGNKCVQRPVVPLFRKSFTISKKIKTALLFVTGLGQYELSINGAKTGTAFLAPGWTYFDKTILYNTFDVTSQLVGGNNAIGAIVGNGFYNINRERYFKIVDAFGMPTMICRLKITYDDGATEDIVSDATWKTSPSPITFSSIYGGEDYDARMEQEGWNKAAFDDSKWMRPLLIKAPKGQLSPEQDYPVALMDSFTVKKIVHPSASTLLYDFGQNISGIIRLKVRGRKGQQVKLIPAELINKNQLANQSATGDPFYFTYTMKSDGEEIWQPKFTYYGFRYVQVDGAVADASANDMGLPVIVQLSSLHNRNSNPVNGNFECSNPLFNRIYTLINWAIKSNMQSIVTDCPHREKLSWLEQDYLMGNSIHYNNDVYHLYRKLVQDLMDAQYPEGFVPDIAPEYVVFEGGFLDSPEWGSSSVILPWLLYQWYGDKDILQKAYAMAKKYVDYQQTKSKDYLLSHGLGDWYDYGPNPPGESQLTPKTVTATSIFYYDATLVSKMATLLDEQSDAKKYAALAASIKTSFNKKFFNSKTNVYSTGSQTAMAMPFSVGLVNEKYKKAVIKNLVDSIYAGNKALTAGDIGFHFLVNALDKGGASQLLFDMNNRDDVPGYGFQLKKGATALTESWPALEDVSNNHLMLGHIMEWFYSGLAGIDQEESSVAFQKIKIRPQPVGDIVSAKGSFHSPYGWVTTDWKKEGKHFLLRVQIPVNATANIYLPAAKDAAIYSNQLRVPGKQISYSEGVAKISIGSGDYEFEVK